MTLRATCRALPRDNPNNDIHQLSVLAGRTMTGRLTVHYRIGVFADKRHKFDQGLLRGLLDSLHRNDSQFDPYKGIDMTY